MKQKSTMSLFFQAKKRKILMKNKDVQDEKAKIKKNLLRPKKSEEQIVHDKKTKGFKYLQKLGGFLRDLNDENNNDELPNIEEK